jgi:glutaryl-CoA dehydrogenase (non-decarboxylating)
MALEPHHQEAEARFRAFTTQFIQPYAEGWDVDESLGQSIISQLADEGFLGAAIGKSWGGQEYDSVTLGLLHEAIARGCSSCRTLLTVHSMVAKAISRWGSQKLREDWAPWPCS